MTEPLIDPTLAKSLARDITGTNTGTAEAAAEGSDLQLVRGVVTAVNTTTKTATVTLRGGSVAGIPYYSQPAVGDTVEMLFVGNQPRIIGALGASLGAPSMVKIAETTLASNATSISITGIPATYKALELRYTIASARAATTDGIRLQFNDEGGTAYEHSMHYNNAGSMGAERALNQSMFMLAETSTLAHAPGSGRLQIDRYAETSYWTVLSGQGGSTIDGTGPWTFHFSGYWKNTAVVTKIAIVSSTGSQLRAGARMTLYGLT